MDIFKKMSIFMGILSQTMNAFWTMKIKNNVIPFFNIIIYYLYQTIIRNSILIKNIGELQKWIIWISFFNVYMVHITHLSFNTLFVLLFSEWHFWQLEWQFTSKSSLRSVGCSRHETPCLGFTSITISKCCWSHSSRPYFFSSFSSSILPN